MAGLGCREAGPMKGGELICRDPRCGHRYAQHNSVIVHPEESRSIWIPEFETEVIETIGSEWPDGVIVTKWERNLLGERRYVGMIAYHPEKIDAGG